MVEKPQGKDVEDGAKFIDPSRHAIHPIEVVDIELMLEIISANF